MSIADIRRHALSLFEQHGLPTMRQEDWKYSDLSRLQPLLDGGNSSHVMDAEPLAMAGLDAYRVVLCDGQVLHEQSNMPDEVSIRSLANLLDAMGEHASEDMARLFELRGDEPLFNGLLALNAAKASDGVCVCVADGAKLDKPLYIQHVGRQTSYLRHAIVLGQQSEAEVVEHYVGDDSHAGEQGGLTSLSSNVILKAGAQLQHIRLQQESVKQSHVARVEVQQLRDSTYHLHSVELGSALTRVDVVVALAEAGASCELNGLFVLGGRQHVDHHTRIDHQAPHCTSRERYRTVLDGRSHGVFNGKVVVHKGAVKSDSSQSNGNLLLSKQAEIDTKPELEIYNDDVKCAHGATVGQLDDKQLFYLRSRGISEAAAQELLTFAFADEVVAKMPNAVVRRFVERAAFAKLPHDEGFEGLLA